MLQAISYYDPLPSHNTPSHLKTPTPSEKVKILVFHGPLHNPQSTFPPHSFPTLSLSPSNLSNFSRISVTGEGARKFFDKAAALLPLIQYQMLVGHSACLKSSCADKVCLNALWVLKWRGLVVGTRAWSPKTWKKDCDFEINCLDLEPLNWGKQLLWFDNHQILGWYYYTMRHAHLLLAHSRETLFMLCNYRVFFVYLQVHNVYF